MDGTANIVSSHVLYKAKVDEGKLFKLKRLFIQMKTKTVLRKSFDMTVLCVLPWVFVFYNSLQFYRNNVYLELMLSQYSCELLQQSKAIM